MSKLYIRTSGSAYKSYDLKDSSTPKPRLAVNVNGTVKYLRLKEGTKSGELNCMSRHIDGGTLRTHYYYASTLRDFVDSDSPTTLSGLAFQRAQSAADGYGNEIISGKRVWDTEHDPENNISLCEVYGFSYTSELGYAHGYGSGSWGGTGPKLFIRKLADAHGYVSGSWGGTGPFRMKLSNGSFYYTVTEPFYFVKSDNAWQSVGGKTGSVITNYGTDRAGTVYVIDVLKNGSSNYSVSTSTPILFNEGDTFGAVIMFTGYNTRSNYGNEVHSWSPKVRLAN